MSGVPRSQPLIVYDFSAGSVSPIWITPTGFVTLVKSVYVQNANTVDALFLLVAQDPSTGLDVRMVQETVTAGTSMAWQGWFALSSGQRVYGYSGVATVLMWLSGAVLAGPAQFPPAGRDVVSELPLLPPGPRAEPVSALLPPYKAV